MDEPELIHDWNESGERWEKPGHRVQLVDGTFRDGLQSPALRVPTIAERIEILHLMDRLGIDAVDLGLPGAGAPVVHDAARLAAEIRDAGLAIRPVCAARALRQDITPILELSQDCGLAIEVCAFVGSSPVRQYAEGWGLERLERATGDAVAYATAHGLPVTFVTEDTVRTPPATLRRLFQAALRSGATRLCLTDTAGHATPTGTANLVRFAQEVVRQSGTAAGLDWHGHADRGLALANALAALRAGASRVHACALGLGERAGNTAMDQLLVNLRLLGWIDRDLGALDEYCRRVSEATGSAIPPAYPAVGSEAFRTGSAMHAAAALKSPRADRTRWAERIVSGVPASLVGRRLEIEIGPLSGPGNAVWWLESHGYTATPERARALFQRARSVDRVLSEGEIHAVLDALEETQAP